MVNYKLGRFKNCTRTHIYTHACMHACTHVHTRTHTRTHTTHTHTHAHTCTCTHTHTHTHTHGLMHVQLFDKVQPGIVDWDKVNKKPFKKMGGNMKRLENCNYAIELAHKMKFSIVGIDGPDIFQGNKTLTLGRSVLVLLL